MLFILCVFLQLIHQPTNILNTRKIQCITNIYFLNLTFVCPYIIIIIVVDDQLDATILDYLFIPSQLYVFRAMYFLITRST